MPSSSRFTSARCWRFASVDELLVRVWLHGKAEVVAESGRCAAPSAQAATKFEKAISDEGDCGNQETRKETQAEDAPEASGNVDVLKHLVPLVTDDIPGVDCSLRARLLEYRRLRIKHNCDVVVVLVCNRLFIRGCSEFAAVATRLLPPRSGLERWKEHVES